MILIKIWSSKQWRTDQSTKLLKLFDIYYQLNLWRNKQYIIQNPK